MTFETILFYGFTCGLPLIIGACLGSFYSVVVYRLPRGESIVWPGSHCPQCNAFLRPWNNIPVLSFIAQRGQCTKCGGKISFLYPGLELATGLLVMVLWNHDLTGFIGPGIPVQCIFIFLVTLLVPLSIIDIQHGILPHRITVPGIVTAAGLAFFPAGITPLHMAYGLVAGGGVLWLISKLTLLFVAPERRIDGATVGGGDIMLLILYGALLGPAHILFALGAGSVLALAGVVIHPAWRSGAFPFGPFLAGGILVSLLWGNSLFYWYLALL